eukprot:TRINITY_DN14219_c0_g1_i4.p2 TRINITY_DN14219_c0_g1~~TRINITY_DN14219_c0_g1_i4.p2  ORF type:complete len:183 (+),score=48.90 TRINITY_DN14219_c0_g1_i4:65-613(+)
MCIRDRYMGNDWMKSNNGYKGSPNDINWKVLEAFGVKFVESTTSDKILNKFDPKNNIYILYNKPQTRFYVAYDRAESKDTFLVSDSRMLITRLYFADAPFAYVFNIPNKRKPQYLLKHFVCFIFDVCCALKINLSENTEKFSTYPVVTAVSYTHLRAHETRHDLVCRLLLEKKKTSSSFFPC